MTESSPPSIALKDLLDLVEKVEGRINSYWNFYMIALFAIGAWIFNPATIINSLQSLGIITALSAFFTANYTFIRINESRLIAIESEIKAVAKKSQLESLRFSKFLDSGSIPNRQKLSFVLHFCVDIIILILVFFKGKG